MLSAAYNVDGGETEDELFHSTSSLVYDHKQSIVNEALLDTIIYENTRVKPSIQGDEKREDDLDGLVRQLLNSLDYEFMEDVLISHRGFVPSDTLLRLIMMYLKEAFKQGNELLKVRAFVVLRTWIVKYGSEDFRPSSGRLLLMERELEEIWKSHSHLSDSDRNIMGKLEILVRSAPDEAQEEVSREGSKSERSFSDKLRRLFGGRRSVLLEEEFIDESTSTTNTTGLSEAGNHRAFDVTKVSAEELAMLLTSIDSQYFSRLNWLDLVTFPRITTDSLLEECLVQRVIDHFNQLCKYLVTLVLRTGEERKRLKLLVKLIRTAEHLRMRERNMNGMMAVVLALQNPAVANLTVWDFLGSRELGVWAALLRLASPLRSFQNVREEEQEKENACIPFIGLLLSDLMGLAEKIEAGSKIMFQEWRQVVAKVKEFKAMQDAWASSSFGNQRVNGQKLKHLWNQIYLHPI